MISLPLGPGTLTLFGKALTQLAPEEALAFGEQPIQLRENATAEFVLEGVPQGWRLREGGVVTLSRARAGAGTISAGNEAGLLTLVLEDAQGRAQATAGIEIVTAKLGYRDDFRTMLEALTRQTTDLLLRLRTEMTSPFVPDPTQDSRTQIQRFFFLRGLLESPRFQAALARILAHPHHVLVPELAQADLGRARHLSSASLRLIASGQPRRTVPSAHPLRARQITTLPQAVLHRRPEASVDTSENRFVRHALESFLSVLTLPAPSNLAEVRLLQELGQLRRPLERALTHPTLTDLGPLTRLPLESAVLQRRSGYRELLQAYFDCQRALQLRWDGGEEVYGGGRRDVAVLYEYWCFFQLLGLVERVFGVCLPAEALLSAHSSAVSLRLKRGVALECAAGGIRLAYNPTQPTWTRPVRPDMTLTLGTNVIHFDAKYRLSSLSGDTLTEDLLEMHAYRDAIPETRAAVVLYPGTKAHWWQQGSGGLGAFPLVPGQAPVELEAFLQSLG